MRDLKKVNKQQCCCEDNDIIECLCAIDQEIECFKNSFGHNKNFNHCTKEKLLFCILLREIGKIDKKLDKILRELDCGWGTDTDSDCDCD